jgi:hypothetical protein
VRKYGLYNIPKHDVFTLTNGFISNKIKMNSRWKNDLNSLQVSWIGNIDIEILSDDYS